ncbi:folylpolyglutamate synthase/dihydrofolate synthase family protein [Ruminococcus sp. Marseille-P6503]|uniref:bifunctional folylpolyglutamate synthase/dihydrofolate synthase n=1 Tax=Ruminococcus sp. Marseille-P6503 TaxID=2364796 RepID=UPI000F526BD2|nr:folylpolyglutamate synthase/dihydrofolate synthase family protein [Ruminococcus sp. Marseille-P6503]
MTEAEKYISSFSRTGKRIHDLDRIRSLLSLVGSPQKKLRFIHIAGTNGKGSMAQMFNEILIDAGYTVGLFTSPYIIEYSDRIKVNNCNISSSELNEIIEKIRPSIERHPQRKEFSQFEITQTIAFLHFVSRGCDIVVLETGMGGLLDSTNVIEKPLVCVIGSVSYDHTAVLGDTLEKIAYQKAGIIKPKCPCVLSPGNSTEVVSIVRERALNTDSPLDISDLALCSVKKSDITGNDFTYRGRDYKTSMAGLHQGSNAVTVIDAMKFVSEALPVSQKSIANGIRKARLFGRVEVISESPLTILDGAHNPDGTKALADSLKALKGRKITAVIGMHKDKNALEAVKNLIPLADSFTAVDGFSDKGLDFDKAELAGLIIKAGGNARPAQESIINEIRKAREENPDGAVLICGSLFLVAYVKANAGKLF